VVKATNGHDLVSRSSCQGSLLISVKLGRITGSGCMTGTLIATFCAAARLQYLADHELFEDSSQLVQGDMFIGALAG
jgi:thiamine-phosphate diphosphorylase/hydroxyethylthiazole kinase